jgi:hypothetical protein
VLCVTIVANTKSNSALVGGAKPVLYDIWRVFGRSFNVTCDRKYPVTPESYLAYLVNTLWSPP